MSLPTDSVVRTILRLTWINTSVWGVRTVGHRTSSDMKPFFNNRTIRGTALLVVLTLLFAAASGVANACLLDARGTRGHGSLEDSLVTKAATSTAHAGAVAGHDADPDTSARLCLKVCDDGSQSLLKQSGFDLLDPAQAPIVAMVWSVAAPVVSMFSREDASQSPARELPIRIRFSRLLL